MKVQTDHASFSRDTKTRALINNNIGELQILKMKRDHINAEESHKREIESLKNMVEELKTLILQGKNNG